MTYYEWGSHFWYVMRCIANNYPGRSDANYTKYTKSFLTGLQYLLPCEICKKNYARHLSKHPLDKYMNSKSDLIRWIALAKAAETATGTKSDNITKSVNTKGITNAGITPNVSVNYGNFKLVNKNAIKPTIVKPVEKKCKNCNK